MGPRPAFVIFGIPVFVDFWFFLGLFLFYQLSGGGRVGVFTAVAIGLFTLIHELGHATVARRLGGGDVHISLNMFVGWASYTGGHRMTRWQRNLVSLAGPLTELAVGVAALGILRLVLPIEGATRDDFYLYTDLAVAITWAGVILAGLNLLPLWPLDGGHVFDSLVSSRFGVRGTRAFLQFTLVASGALFIGTMLSRGRTTAIDEWISVQWGRATFTDSLPVAVLRILITTPAIALTSAGFIALFTGLNAWQALQQLRAGPGGDVPTPSRRALATEEAVRQARTAERHGWTGVDGTAYPKGWGPSPWLEAHGARLRGAPASEVTQLLGRLARPADGWLVDDMSRPEIGALLPFVPPDLEAAPNVVAARIVHGPPDELVSGALAAYRGSDEPEAFYVIAEGMAERGLLDDAMSWLTGAVERRPDPRRVATSRHLQVLHGRSDYQQLLGVAERAVAPPRTPR